MNKLKIKHMLMLLILIFVLIPALIVSIVISSSTASFYKESYNKNLETMVRQKVLAVNRSFSQYISNVALISDLSYIIETIDGKYESVSKDVSGIIELTINEQEDILDILVVDGLGGIIASSKGAGKGESFFGFNDPMQQVDVMGDYISPVITGNEKYEKDVFFVSRKIEGSKEVGYVVAVINLDTMKRLLNSVQHEDSFKMYILDSAENLVNFNSSSGVMNIMQTDSSYYLKEATYVSYMTDTPYPYKDKHSFGSYLRTAYGNWYVFGTVSNSEVKPFASPNSFISLIVIIIPSVAAIIAGFFAIRLVTIPMRKMSDIMESIRNGERDARFNIGGKNEFGAMAESLNELLDEIILSEERHRTISDISDNMLFEWDFKREKMYVSDNFFNKFTINTSEATLINGRFIESLMPKEQVEGYSRCINSLLKNSEKVIKQFQLKTNAGAYVWVSFCAQCITDRLGEILRVVGVITDIDNEKRLELRLAERASFDFLSQLYNRSTFERQLSEELKRSVRLKNALAVIFIDLDDFKHINDRYGHSCGDDVIKFVADKVKELCENKGFAGRFGGDEFVMCITDIETASNIESLALALLDGLYEGFFSETGNAHMCVKASIGIAISPQHGDTIHDLLRSTDEAMYFVKKHGKANYHIYNPNELDSDDVDL